MSARRPIIRSLALGAGLMYYLDPRSGHRRRLMLRDKGTMLVHDLTHGLGVTSRDLRHRLQGVIAEARSAITPETDVPDDVLIARIRAKLGRAVSHPRALEIMASQGRVTVRGAILDSEIDDLMDALYSTRGVTWVDNQTQVHATAENIPDLQGQGRMVTTAASRHLWSPTRRLFASLLGGYLTLRGASRGSWIGTIGAGLGLGLLTRALTNLDARQLLGLTDSERVIDVQKTMTIHAPVATVFAFMSHPENYPRIMEHAKEVRRIDADRHHWTVAGPAGLPIEFDSEITECRADEFLAWRSVPGSPVAQTGMIHFEAMGDGATRVVLQMSYNPPAGALGHAVAALFGADPKHALDDDLIRLKSLLEEGKTTAHGHQVTREDLGR